MSVPSCHPQPRPYITPLFLISSCWNAQRRTRPLQDRAWDKSSVIREVHETHSVLGDERGKGELLASLQPSHPNLNEPFLDLFHCGGPLPSAPSSTMLLLFAQCLPTQNAKPLLHLMQEVQSHATFCELLELWGILWKEIFKNYF